MKHHIETLEIMAKALRENLNNTLSPPLYQHESNKSRNFLLRRENSPKLRFIVWIFRSGRGERVVRGKNSKTHFLLFDISEKWESCESHIISRVDERCARAGLSGVYMLHVRSIHPTNWETALRSPFPYRTVVSLALVDNQLFRVYRPAKSLRNYWQFMFRTRSVIRFL